MAVSYLLDTNIVSEIALPHPARQVQRLWNIHRGHAAMAAITWHELLYGLQRMPDSIRKRGTRQLLLDILYPTLPILAYDEAAAVWHVRERARLTALGRSPAYADGQIAAIAATSNLTLVTRNVADFADFAGLSLENWFEA